MGLAGGSRRPPATLTGPQQLAPTPNPSQETLLEEMQLATNFLLAAQLSRAHLFSRAEMPAELAAYGAAWKAEDAIGAVKIYLPRPGLTGLELASEIFVYDAQGCTGKVDSGR